MYPSLPPLSRCAVPSTAPATGKCKQETAFPMSDRRKDLPVPPAKVGLGPMKGDVNTPGKDGSFTPPHLTTWLQSHVAGPQGNDVLPTPTSLSMPR